MSDSVSEMTFENTYMNSLKLSRAMGTLDGFAFVNNKEKAAFKLIEWIVVRNLPLCEVDNKHTRELLNIKPVASKSLRKYILSLASHVEKEIERDLPETFALQIEGWTSNDVNYVALFASYVADGGDHKETLLALAPLSDEKRLGPAQYQDFMEATLKLHSKTLDNVAALIGDDCATNREISNNTSIPLVVCASHKFDLAVNAWLDHNTQLSKILDKVRDIIVNLRNMENAARLRSLTDLCPVKHDVTCWTFKYDMAKLYIQLEPELKKIKELKKHLLCNNSRRKFDTLMFHLNNFHSITINLQQKGVSLGVVRQVFNSVIEDYPIMEQYLHLRANIVKNSDFETGVVKIMDKNFSGMTEMERKATSALANPHKESATPEVSPTSSGKGYFEECTARKRARLNPEEQLFIDCSFLVATSNSLKRLLRAGRHVVTYSQEFMSQKMLTTLIYLKINRQYWDLTTVARAMKNNVPKGNPRG